MAAQTLVHSHSYLGAFLRRKKSQLGSPKAITATAHKLAKIVYFMLKHKSNYIDLGEHYYEKKYQESLKKQLINKASRLGLTIVKNASA